MNYKCKKGWLWTLVLALASLLSRAQTPFYWSNMTCTINGEFWGDCNDGILGLVSRTFGQRFMGSYIDFTGME
ncbi:MAG: hypothetical protein RLP14_05490 [Owenweeksia sp.]